MYPSERVRHVAMRAVAGSEPRATASGSHWRRDTPVVECARFLPRSGFVQRTGRECSSLSLAVLIPRQRNVPFRSRPACRHECSGRISTASDSERVALDTGYAGGRVRSRPTAQRFRSGHGSRVQLAIARGTDPPSTECTVQIASGMSPCVPWQDQYRER